MSLAEANRKYFDAIGDAYDNKPWFAKVNQQVTDSLRSQLSWVGIPFANIEPGSSVPTTTNDVRLLDYACGTGLMSRVFGPYVTFIQGVDISPNMVKSFNNRARDAGLADTTINAVVGDLLAPEQPAKLSGPEYFNYDLATVGFGFHHFENVIEASKRLKERLRPGGVLLINDFLEGGDVKVDDEGNEISVSSDEVMHAHHQHVGHSHGHNHDHRDHHHHDKKDEDDPTLKVRKEMNASVVVPSFTEEGVKKFFGEAGLVDVEVKIMEGKAYMEFAGNKMWRTIFFARGRRPLEGEKSEL